jgi:hypothetical protein
MHLVCHFYGKPLVVADLSFIYILRGRLTLITGKIFCFFVKFINVNHASIRQDKIRTAEF